MKDTYNTGTNALSGQSFIDDFLSAENAEIKESHDVVLVLMKSDEIDVVVEEIIEGEEKQRNPTINVVDRGAYWWIKATGKIDVDCDLATELLGKSYNVYDFLVNVSSTVGRAYTNGNTFTITTELMGIERNLEDIQTA